MQRSDRAVAHTPREGSEDWHYLDDHLRCVAEKARAFAGKFGAGELAYWAGWLHDIGKSNPKFKDYLERCHDAERNGRPKPQSGSVPHAIHGAVAGNDVFTEIDDDTSRGKELAWVIANHHGGLQHRERLNERLTQAYRNDEVASIIGDALDLLPEEVIEEVPHLPNFDSRHSREFFIRMLLSALVDADHLDTEAWRNPAKNQRRKERSPSTEELLKRLTDSQNEKIREAPENNVNTARREIYEAALEKAAEKSGFFKLTVPTGGGKTRTALSFALKHLKDNGVEDGRVIFAIPYTSIIDQTAREFRAILEGEGDESVLEHHSALNLKDEEKDTQNWSRLAAENWNAPVIVTTTVQLFESMFGNRTSKVRKLHNLARSVIVLDEAQTLPAHLLDSILDGLRELVSERYGASVVFCTATQPALDKVLEELGTDANVREISPRPEHYFRSLERVKYETHLDNPWNWEKVAEVMQGSEQALCIVNTKAQARDLYKTLDTPDAFHLSTAMYSAHRKQKLEEIEKRLERGDPCQIVSTQLIEAGIDISLPLVLRALAPLDSIVQAAGRCNREGELAFGRVVVFVPENHTLPSGIYKTATPLTEELLSDAKLNLNAPATFDKYFSDLFLKLVDRDAKGIQELRGKFNYPEVAKKFNMIADDTVGIIIRKYAPDNVTPVLQSVKRWGISRGAFRKLQPYMVNVYLNKLEELEKQGFIAKVQKDLDLYEWTGRYDEDLGILEEFDVDGCVQ